MRFRASLIAAFCLAAFLACAVFALEWPTDSKSAPLTFGSGDHGRFVSGIVTGSKDGLVRAASGGELFFYLDKPELACGLPSTLRSFAALEGDDGLSVAYGGLAPGSVSAYLTKAETGDILGRVDRFSEGLFLSVYDRAKQRRINPFIFMRPPADERQPSIRAAALAQGDKLWPLGDTRAVKQGTYELVAFVEDPDDARPEGTIRAPYRVRVFLDGAEKLNHVYEVSESKAGRAGFFGMGPDAPAYWKPDGRVSLGSYLLSRGKASILIVVKDHADNEREAGFTVLVE